MKALLIPAALILLVGCDETKTPPQAIATPVTASKTYEILDYEYTVIVDRDTCDYFMVVSRNEGLFKCSSGTESLTDHHQSGKHAEYTSTGIIH